ncbi:hypothetical protein JAAARDRAFT_43938 [Jaapia argillacea MUCL 33604]|uniref:Uncharacterized protein n=1 Tax=Jaapia argillacea MUCL 33604 TaxID=933084 RepID=A0A067QDS0_9AGAM|nr:hypothetical protein JAAARDRAFT_43938 [Jaapia argillacea MUCL 33604]
MRIKSASELTENWMVVTVRVNFWYGYQKIGKCDAHDNVVKISANSQKSKAIGLWQLIAYPMNELARIENTSKEKTSSSLYKRVYDNSNGTRRDTLKTGRRSIKTYETIIWRLSRESAAQGVNGKLCRGSGPHENKDTAIRHHQGNSWDLPSCYGVGKGVGGNHWFNSVEPELHESGPHNNKDTAIQASSGKGLGSSVDFWGQRRELVETSGSVALNLNFTHSTLDDKTAT